MNNKDFLQKIKMNNFYDKSKSNVNELIWNSIETADETLIHSLNTKIFDTYHAKLNLLYNLLYSTEPLPIKDKKSIINLIKILISKILLKHKEIILKNDKYQKINNNIT